MAAIAKRRDARFVGFFGPDSAGKSTQARMLVAYLRSKGYRSKLTWIRGRHLVAFVLAEFLVRVGYYRTVKGLRGGRYKVFDPQLLPELRLFWGFIEFISVLPWIILRVYLPKFLGYTVVAERYVVDTVVYLGYWLDRDFLKGVLASTLLKLIPSDSMLIHLDAEKQVLCERIKDDYIPREFLFYQQEVYRIIAKKIGAVTIDTSQSTIAGTFQQILKVVESS